MHAQVHMSCLILITVSVIPSVIKYYIPVFQNEAALLVEGIASNRNTGTRCNTDWHCNYCAQIGVIYPIQKIAKTHHFQRLRSV